jgi:hypothetical protein
MPRNTRPLRYVQNYQINPNVSQLGKYYYQSFMDGAPPLMYSTAAGGFGTLLAAGAGALGAGATTKLAFPGTADPLMWDAFGTTAQTLVVTPTAGSGLEISADEVDNESIEFVPGMNVANSRLAFNTTTSSPFFVRAKFKLTDASGSDQFGVGFRKQETFATPTSFLAAGDPIYTDIVLFGFAGTKAAANPVRVSTDINNGGSATVTDTNFTWADGKAHSLEIRVYGRSCRFFINGVRLGDIVSLDGDGAAITAQSTFSAASYTFQAGLTLVPYIFVRHDTDVLEDAFLQEFECGSLVDVGRDPDNE